MRSKEWVLLLLNHSYQHHENCSLLQSWSRRQASNSSHGSMVISRKQLHAVLPHAALRQRRCWLQVIQSPCPLLPGLSEGLWFSVEGMTVW